MENELERAAASWFGMDPDKVHTSMITSGPAGLALQVVLRIDADDYLGIADRMRAMREPEGDPDEQPEFVALPSMQEVMRDPVAFMDRPECVDLLVKAVGMSKAVCDKVEAERKRRTENPGGQGEAPGGLPDAVWIKGAMLDDAQKDMASDLRRLPSGNEYLVQTAMLTPEQIDLARRPRAANPIPTPSPGTSA